MRIALIAAVAVAFASTVSAHAADQKSYNPGTTPAKSTQQTDYAATAKQHVADFVTRKKDCFVKAGLVEGQTFRVSPNDDTMIQVRDNVWLQPAKYNLDAVKQCAAMSH